MTSDGLLTSDDLDEIGFLFRDQPCEVAAKLVNAVDQGLVADPADTGYALILAAELIERAGDLPAAQVLAERAVEACRVHGEPDSCARAFHAQLLLQLGRTDEGLAELTALRPLFLEDTGAVSPISEALELGGYPEIAEQWLTEELATALQRQQALDSQRGEPAYEHATEVVYGLVQERSRIRRDLGLPRDERDYLAEVLSAEMCDMLGIDPLGDEGIAVLFWPQPEFERLLLRWPVLAEEYGQTWDAYLATMQRNLVAWSESEHSRLVVSIGAVDELAHYAQRAGSDPTDPQVREDYAWHLAEHPRRNAEPQP